MKHGLRAATPQELPVFNLRFIRGSNPSLIWCPDDFVHLQLEAHGQRVGDDAFDKFEARQRRLPAGHGLQHFVALVRLQRRDPREEQGTTCRKLVLRDLRLCPRVIFHGADDELDFIGGLEVRDVLPTIALRFTAAGAFQVHEIGRAHV